MRLETPERDSEVILENTDTYNANAAAITKSN
jgi:hypothetical protein